MGSEGVLVRRTALVDIYLLLLPPACLNRARMFGTRDGVCGTRRPRVCL